MYYINYNKNKTDNIENINKVNNTIQIIKIILKKSVKFVFLSYSIYIYI